MFLWGGLSMCMAAAHSWQVVAGLRFILGILEASFAPGVLFLLSAWYKKGELGRRYSVYYTAVALSGMFGGLIAGGLLQTLDGAHGISGWRWLFIVEGAGTCLVSVGALFALPDFPSTTRWLTPDERALASRRLAGDSLGDTQDGETIHHKVALKMALTDWRTWAFVLTYMSTTGAQTIQYFIPELVKVCQTRLLYSPHNTRLTRVSHRSRSQWDIQVSKYSTTPRQSTSVPSWPSLRSVSLPTISRNVPFISQRPRRSPLSVSRSSLAS